VNRGAVLALVLVATPAAAQDAYVAQYEAAFLADATYGPQFAAMKANYPVEWNEMIGESVRRLASGQSPKEVDGWRREYLQRFNASLRPDMRRAPAGLLAEYARANGEFMSQLRREDVAACAAIVSQRPPPPEAAERFSDATRKALVKSQAAMIRAAKAGAANPVQHGPPTRADDAAVSLVMTEAGGVPADVAKVGDPNSSLSPKQRCEAGVLWSMAIAKTSNTIIARQMNR
jgi:hypothetical protein